MKIQDGAGSGKITKVNQRNRLDVSSATFSESHLIAAEDAATFIWTTSWDADNTEEVIYLKNDSKTKSLVIDKVTVNSVNTGLFELFSVTGTASGTTITGVNTNRTSGNVADATALGEAEVTGLTIGDRIDLARVPANGRATMELQDVLILGLGDAIAVTYTGADGIVDIIITGYYQSEGDL